MQVCSLAPRGIRVTHPGYPGFYTFFLGAVDFPDLWLHSAFGPTRMKRVVTFISFLICRPTLAESRPHLSSGFFVCFASLAWIESGGR